MAITYFGYGATPADNGANPGPTATVTPPASMLDGDLVLLYGTNRNVTVTFSVSVTGGQTWNSLTNDAQGSARSSRLFWARFNGTWTADPVVSRGDADTINFSGYMLVFRPSAGANTWAVDVAEVLATAAAPGAPNDSSIAEITTLTNGAVIIASWLGETALTRTLQTAGWANPSGIAQFRNTTGSDMSISFAYKIQPTAGGTGAVVNRLAANVAQRTRIVAFKEIVTAVDYLQVDTQPVDTQEDTVMPEIEVSFRQGEDDAIDTGFTGNVTAALSSGPGTLSGTTTVAAVAGVATFDDLQVSDSATGYTLIFSASGVDDVESDSFDITPQSATKFIFHVQPTNADVDEIISPAVVVRAVNDANVLDTTWTGTVEIELNDNPAGATLNGTLTKAAVAGVATFDDLSLDAASAEVVTFRAREA